MQYHSISAAAVGAIPGADITVQKLVIQKSAIKKIGQIFGIDIDLVNKEKENKNINKEDNKDSSSTNEEKSSGNKYLEILIKYSLKAADSGVTIGKTILKYAPNAGQISTEIACTTLRTLSISFFFVGSAVGIGLGYYFMYKNCQEIIDKLYEYFIENVKTLSSSYEQAIKYFESKILYYSNLEKSI